MVYLNPKDAEQLGIADDGWAEIHNDYGKIFMLVKHSTMVRPGVAYYFHAWEPYQFPNHQSYKNITPGLTNPLHFTGGERQLNMSLNFLQPGSFRSRHARRAFAPRLDRSAGTRTRPRPVRPS